MDEQQEDKIDPSTVKKLVKRIKACTFLPYMNEYDWTTDIISIIEEFITKDQQILCLFYENDILKATFCIPDARTDTIMWFLKMTDKETARLDNSNFLKLVAFGKIDAHVEKTMFLLMDSLYSPFVFSWSASEKDLFFEQYRAVIQELCSLRYKFLGMPSIYIPTIVGKLDESSKSVSEETLKVLENILNVYTIEIQKCLMDNERVPSKCEYMMEHIIDEIDYWKNRLTNLRFITTLLSYKSVDEILTILKQHQSILIHSFNNIVDEIESAKIECKFNLNYLQILREPVMSLYDVNSPNDILLRLPDIFMKFIFIFEESPSYNKWSDINRLYEYLGNQIVFICRKTIKLSDLFSGNTESILNNLKISINCCENYISVYTKVIQIYNSKNDGHWSVETKDVHMFLDRCRDVNYICKSMVLFKRLNEKHTIPKPRFSFTKGLEFEKVMESIEFRFNKLINNLENVQNVIFNVNTTDWYQHELEFKDEVKELCTIVEQLLNDALSIACNTEDALNVLQSLHYFSGWPQLNSHFQKKTNEVYNMLIDEISFAMQFYTGNSYNIPSFMVPYSGVCITAMTEYRRITTLKNMISERPWLLPGIDKKKFYKVYKNYKITYQELIYNTFELWNNQVNTNHEKNLKKNILVGNQNDQFWHLTINLDSDTFDLVTEIEYWSLIGFKHVFKPNFIVINATKIKKLHRNTSKIVNDYNSLIAGLSEQEMLLFSESIELCNKITSPMIQYYTWKQQEIDRYLLNCYDEFEMVQNIINDYKYCNIEIVKNCEEIANLTLFKMNQVQILELKDLKMTTEAIKRNKIMKIVDNYDLILKYIMVIYEGLHEQIDNIMVYWIHYIEKIDNLICKALILNCQCSLENILELSIGDGSGPLPVIQIHVSLEGNKIKYSSNLSEILAFSVNFFTDILMSIKIIPKLSHSLKLPTNTISYKDDISNDWICTKLQEKYTLATINALRRLRRYMREFLIFKNIWSMDKKLFFQKYKTFNSSAIYFNQDMTQYSIYKRKISHIKPIAQVAHFLIQTNMLKDEIIRHCDEWRNNFSDLLLDMTTNLIEGFYHYAQTNSLQVMTSPKNLIEMIEFIDLRKKIVLEYDNKAKEFTLISDNVKILEINNIQMPEVMKIKYEKLFKVWSVYKNTLEDAEIMLKRKQNEFMNTLMEKQTNLKIRAKELLQIFLETAPISTKWNSNDALNYAEQTQNELKTLKSDEKQLNDDLSVFHIKYICSSEIKKLEEETLVLHSVWKLVNTWDNIWIANKMTKFWDVQVSEMKETVDTFLSHFNTLVDGLKIKKWEVIETTRNKINEFRNLLPVVEDLKNPAMRVRHWNEIRNIINKKFDETNTDFTIEKLVELKIQNYSEQISEVSKKSTMELGLENAIKNIKKIWASVNIYLQPYKDKGIYYVKVNDDIFQSLEDHLVQLSVIKTSKYISDFLNEADYLEKSLGLVMEVLEILLSVQRQHIYLENIFIGDDVRQKMPIENLDYDILTEEWKEITSQIDKENNLFKTCYSKSLYKHLNTMNYRLEVIQRALELHMESKRHIFPRFYFISNCELLEILGNSKNPESIQPHLKKLFNHIDNIKIVTNNNQKKEARGMFSKDGEYIEWNQPILCDGPAEIWLNSIECAMRNSLKQTLKHVKLSLMKNLKSREKWILDWPGQLCITASQIQWTADCTRALVHSKCLKHKYPLKKIFKKQTNILTKLSKIIRNAFDNCERLKVTSLILIEMHARDVIEYIYKSNCLDVSAFEWISQLRFYWDKKANDVIIKQTNTKHQYGYEYLGNSKRLVITPLTDRCYITLTTAIYMYRGGNLHGLSYVGKTETIKDLGKHLARYVIVVDFSENLDYKSMRNIFLGLVQQGAWGCFDDIHRIKIEVLSSITQQIWSIFSALAADSKTLVIENNNVTLVPTCGIFITTRPSYEDNSNLPDNFKLMFRTVSMVVPDIKLIAETILFGKGFKNSKNLANKIFTLFSLCKQLLNKQNNCEYGLRSLIELIKYAGKYKRENSEIPDDEIILLAVHKTSLPTLDKEDLPVFLDISNNIFPDIVPPELKQDVLVDAIKRSMLKNNLQPSDSVVSQIVQLYETKCFRRSVILIGHSGTAKSTKWKALRDTLVLLKSEQVNNFETVIDYVLNPKTLTSDEMYGKYNQDTHEWVDGILSSILRKVCTDDGLEQKWIIFDGPIDNSWIENMSSVMDDNNVLNLINGERILIPKQVSFLFEVEDLGSASPAIISRCGIVYNDHNDYTWKLYVDSWLKNFKFKLYEDAMRFNFNHYIDDFLTFKRINCIELVRLTDQNCIISLCKLLECCTTYDLTEKIPVGLNETQYKFLIKIWFIFCMIWSVCGCINEDGKKKIDIYIRGLENVFPLKDTVYHYYVDNNSCKFKHWEDKLSMNKWEYNSKIQFSEIIIPTIDTVRYSYLIQLYLSKKQPVLLSGPSGSGKTMNVKNVFELLNKKKYSFLNINMTAQTTSNDVQETVEEKLEKRTKELYIPISGKTMITFLDDIHMPIKEACGAQPSLELIRQWVDYGFWYDKTKQCPKYVKNMLFVCAMTQFSNVRHSISNRIMSCFSVINLTIPEENDIYKIYHTILSQHLTDFDETVSDLGNTLTSMTISLYKNIIINMTPTPTKIHYLFNLKDISKVFQGLLRSNVKYQNFKVPMLRLWCHEVFRVFYDRLTDENDKKWFVNQIDNQLENNFHLTYRNLCKSEKNPIFCNFLNEKMLYEEIVDIEYLKRFIENSIKEYNSNSDFVPLNELLFRDSIEHICRIVRVISQPKGHILLIGIGGSGKTSLAKIASWLCKYSIFTIELSESYGRSEFKEDLKLIYFETGIKNQPTSFVFNDSQIVDDSFLKIINNILNTGEVTRLYKENEFEEIKNALSDVNKHSDEIETAEAINSYFVNRVKNNLHFILSFSPIENVFRARLRQYPALINCTTIDWFLDWPKETLLEVATASLSDFDISATITEEPKINEINNEEITQDKLKSFLVFIFASIHLSVIEYSNRIKVEVKHSNNVTPAVYLEMINRYKETLKEKRIEKQNNSIKLRNGLQKINGINNKINDMTKELEKITELITKNSKECEEMSSIISNCIVEIDEKKKEIDTISKKIKEDEFKCQEMYDLALSELKLTIPGLEEATDKVCDLNKKDLSEIKGLSKPPESVKLILEAVMTLKQADPSWAEAKRQLGDPSFLDQIKHFDKDHVTDDVLTQIDLFLKNPEFNLEKISTLSSAAKYLGKWVIAIDKYAKMYRTVSPKKASADLAMSTVKEEKIALEEIERNLTEKQNILEKQKLEYEETITKKENHINKAEELKNNLEKATKLINGLSKERNKWNKTVNQIYKEFEYLPGDSVLSTAFISYMGPFKSECREFLMKLWLKFMKENGALNNPNFEVTLFLTDPAKIRNWNNHGLSNDNFSIENGIIISQSYRYPFIIDPQNQAWNWIKNIESDNELQIIDYRSTNNMRTLEIALQNGYPTLIQINFENLNPHVISILSKSIVKQRNKLFIKMGSKLLPYNENFRLFITTKIKNCHYLPQIMAQMTIVDFSIQEEGLEEQLLKTLVNLENPGLEELKDNTIINIEKDKKSLLDLQDELLKLLDESESSLLENDHLLQTLRSSKATFSIIKEHLQSSLSNQAEIYIAREGYRPCAKRASILYFVLHDMDKINPMYQYSLDFYIALFKNSIKKSNTAEQLQERITYINEYHTYAVYENVCRGLFEHHKLLLSFQICIKILITENEINFDELKFLLNGGIEEEKKKLVTTKCPNWLPSTCWNNILALSNLPDFHEVEKSIDQFSTEWHTWYLSSDPENQKLIGQWEHKCNSFQRILFIRSLRLDRLSFAIKNFISTNFGSKFSEEPMINLKNVQDDLNNKNALIFILSSGADPTNLLINMATSCNKKDKFKYLSLGNGLESTATNLIQIGQTEGYWIYLANCHHLITWMPKLDKIIETMQDGKAHPDFRLWLSSKPHQEFPITILQTAIKLSSEQPKNIKSSLSHLYNRSINEEKFSQNQSSSKYKKILFNLCFFHSILVERKIFKNFGWNEVYDFSDSDFEASENILFNYLNEYEDTPWTALKYLIGSIFYGGNVFDIWDKRLLDTYINQFFNENSITTSFYKCSSSMDFCVPENGSLQTYKDFIETLPIENMTQILGQHSNAYEIYLTKENSLLCETLVFLQEQNNRSLDNYYKENQVLLTVSRILQDIPTFINYQTIAKNIEITKNLMDFVLLQEVKRYNYLLKKIKTTLMTLEKGITGLINIPPDLEIIFHNIYEGKVPDQWLKTYPTVMNLGAWMQNLIGRVKYFTSWTNTNKQPISIWLGAFTFPTSFLTGILQNESKKYSIQIDQLDWEFIPISTPLNDLTESPNKGVYIHNLHLEGAGWDDKNMCLCEPLSLELTTKLPVIHFLPVEGKRKLQDVYPCPVYYCPKRSNVQEKNSFVVVLNLCSGSQNPEHWIKRATAVLLNLEN